MTHVDWFLVQYGYVAIFALLMLGIVGPLIPDETILVLAGLFVHRGQLHFLPAVLAGIAGSICGISLSYLIGFHGYGWVARAFPRAHAASERHLARAEMWFARFGKWTLFFGYFVAGVRHFTALFAGISCMPYREFAPPAYSGAVFWTLTFISIGYFVGEQWSMYSGTFDRVIVVCAAALVLCTLVIWRMRRKPTANSRP